MSKNIFETLADMAVGIGGSLLETLADLGEWILDTFLKWWKNLFGRGPHDKLVIIKRAAITKILADPEFDPIPILPDMLKAYLEDQSKTVAGLAEMVENKAIDRHIEIVDRDEFLSRLDLGRFQRLKGPPRAKPRAKPLPKRTP